MRTFGSKYPSREKLRIYEGDCLLQHEIDVKARHFVESVNKKIRGIVSLKRL